MELILLWHVEWVGSRPQYSRHVESAPQCFSEGQRMARLVRKPTWGLVYDGAAKICYLTLLSDPEVQNYPEDEP